MQFEITVEEANVIVAALAELPFRTSAPLIQKLQEQGRTQLSQTQEAGHPNGGASQGANGHEGVPL